MVRVTALGGGVNAEALRAEEEVEEVVEEGDAEEGDEEQRPSLAGKSRKGRRTLPGQPTLPSQSGCVFEKNGTRRRDKRLATDPRRRRGVCGLFRSFSLSVENEGWIRCVRAEGEGGGEAPERVRQVFMAGMLLVWWLLEGSRMRGTKTRQVRLPQSEGCHKEEAPVLVCLRRSAESPRGSLSLFLCTFISPGGSGYCVDIAVRM